MTNGHAIGCIRKRWFEKQPGVNLQSLYARTCVCQQPFKFRVGFYVQWPLIST